MRHYKTVAEFHRDNDYPPPENPMVSLITCEGVCGYGDSEFTADFYMVGFKKLESGTITYGRTKYDHDCGSMTFVRPRQVVKFENLVFSEKGFNIFFHEDFLNGHFLHEEIKKYGFFDYETNESLHLSPAEERTMWDLYHKIEAEYNNNTDEYSRDIMLTHIDSILKYSQRYYKRQFINRTELSGRTVSKFNDALAIYFKDGDGLPTVNALAVQLHLSPRYLSDLLKQETGKTAIELIHIYLIREAKNRLKGEDQSISEVAYALGFENLPYFSRLFKKEVGVSPNQFKKQMAN